MDHARRAEGGTAVNHMRREGQWAMRQPADSERQGDEDVTKRDARDGQRKSET